jgi:hypothetical protein
MRFKEKPFRSKRVSSMRGKISRETEEGVDRYDNTYSHDRVEIGTP